MSDFSRSTLLVSALLALLGAGAAVGDALPDTAVGTVAGRVTAAESPLGAARVYAYQLADLSLSRVITNPEGRFFFDALPAGLYKIIAFKSGFVPAIVMLSRASAEASQFLDLELAPAERVNPIEGGFWSVREQIPSDVLRDIERGYAEVAAVPEFSIRMPDAEIRASMQATAGVTQGLEFGSGQVTSGRVGIDGRIRDLKMSLTGVYSELVSDGGRKSEEIAGGHAQRVSFRFESEDHARVNFTTHANQMTTLHRGGPAEVGFESHIVSWSQPVGREGRSDVTAQYTAETNFYSQGRLAPQEIPDASRAWRVEGSYTTPVTDRATIQAGFRYRELDSFYEGSRRDPLMLLPEETVELFGRGGLRVKPALLVEYGLYSTLRDGSLSLAPQGGVVVSLGSNWRASTLASMRVHDGGVPELRDFAPVYHGERGSCDQGEEHCYRLLISRLFGEDEGITFGATHREYGDTMRLFFDRDFFNRLESLYLVRGDRVPELQFEVKRRLAPTILTRLQSSVAAGGGGVVLANNQRTYENEVRYLVTSLDTRFEDTSTGVFLAFHRLEQALSPLGRPGRGVFAHPEIALERLQLMLTQNLGAIHKLASDWAVHLNMEVSRGATPETASFDDDELRKRLTGGLAVRF